jgi:arylsulfatase A
LITRWPGTIPAGVSEHVVSTIDLAASLAALTGVELPDDACVDSLDVLPALLGAPNAAGREYLVQQDNGQNGNYGLRAGRWKLQRYDAERTTNVELRLTSIPVPRYQLFDLAADPGETRDVQREHPDQAARMIAQLQQIIDAGRTRAASSGSMRVPAAEVR